MGYDDLDFLELLSYTKLLNLALHPLHADNFLPCVYPLQLPRLAWPAATFLHSTLIIIVTMMALRVMLIALGGWAFAMGLQDGFQSAG